MLNFKEILKETGCKITPARIAILEFFYKNKLPLNAEIIYKKIQTKYNINETTIYRTLTSLEGKGILRKVDLRKDSVFFELNDDHHHHIICVKCNLIENFKSEKIEKILKEIVEDSSNFKKIKEHSFELFGFCKNCLN